jgi:hypothetical protein
VLCGERTGFDNIDALWHSSKPRSVVLVRERSGVLSAIKQIFYHHLTLARCPLPGTRSNDSLEREMFYVDPTALYVLNTYTYLGWLDYLHSVHPVVYYNI